MTGKTQLTSRGRIALGLGVAVTLTVAGLVASYLNAARPPVVKP